METISVSEKISKTGFSFHDFKRQSSTNNFPTALADYIRSFGEVYFWEKGNFHVITKALHAKEILTSDQLGNIMYLLATHHEIQREVRAHPLLIPKMIEELKRFDPAVTFIFRVARKDTSIGGQPIKVGDVIFISTHAINRDLPEGEKPEELNIHRNFVNFSYGHGPHYCIGAKLARMEIKALFEELIRELPPLYLDKTKTSKRDHYSLSFSGFKTLNLITG